MNPLEVRQFVDANTSPSSFFLNEKDKRQDLWESFVVLMTHTKAIESMRKFPKKMEFYDRLLVRFDDLDSPKRFAENLFLTKEEIQINLQFNGLLCKCMALKSIIAKKSQKPHLKEKTITPLYHELKDIKKTYENFCADKTISKKIIKQFKETYNKLLITFTTLATKYSLPIISLLKLDELIFTDQKKEVIQRILQTCPLTVFSLSASLIKPFKKEQCVVYLREGIKKLYQVINSQNIDWNFLIEKLRSYGIDENDPHVIIAQIFLRDSSDVTFDIPKLMQDPAFKASLNKNELLRGLLIAKPEILTKNCPIIRGFLDSEYNQYNGNEDTNNSLVVILSLYPSLINEMPDEIRECPMLMEWAVQHGYLEGLQNLKKERWASCLMKFLNNEELAKKHNTYYQLSDYMIKIGEVDFLNSLLKKEFTENEFKVFYIRHYTYWHKENDTILPTTIKIFRKEIVADCLKEIRKNTKSDPSLSVCEEKIHIPLIPDLSNLKEAKVVQVRRKMNKGYKNILKLQTGQRVKLQKVQDLLEAYELSSFADDAVKNNASNIAKAIEKKVLNFEE